MRVSIAQWDIYYKLSVCVFGKVLTRLPRVVFRGTDFKVQEMAVKMKYYSVTLKKLNLGGRRRSRAHM